MIASVHSEKIRLKKLMKKDNYYWRASEASKTLSSLYNWKTKCEVLMRLATGRVAPVTGL